MFWKYFLLGCSIAFCNPTWTLAQECIPHPVEYIGFSSSTELSWWPSENCEGTQYMVRIHTDGLVEYEYIIDSLSLDISFLNYCRNYNFTVTPVAEHVLGMQTYLTAAIALPSDIDIAVLGFSTSDIDDDILLQWHVPENYSHCVTYYLVKVWDEDHDDPEILYIRENGYLLQNAPHCMKYSFEITAYYYIWIGTTGYYNYTMPGKVNNPSLEYLRQDTTIINTTWSLESFSLNRCNLTALYVQGPRFNITIPIEDSFERPASMDVSITELIPNSMYYFNVTLENEAGLSRPFQLAVQTLPVESDFET